MDILFVAYGGGHINALVPVAKLAKDAGHNARVLALTTARRTATAAGLDPIPLSNYMDLAGENAEVYGEELVAGLGSGPVEPSESVAYLGASFAELAEDVGEDQAYDIYSKHGRSKFLPERFFERILKALRPDVVVATSAPRSERAAILAARRQKIPAVCVVDLFATAEAEWVCDNQYANRVCVLSGRVKDRLVSRRRMADDIIVTGNPAFDELRSENFVSAGRGIRQRLGWNDRFVVGWASQLEPESHPFTGRAGDPELPVRIEECLVEWASAMPDRALAVRLHPSERRPSPAKSDSVRISAPSEPVEAMLHSCDCLVTMASTVGLQAALVGLPVVTYDASVLAEGAPYSEMGISLGVTRIDDIELAIDAVRKGEWRSSSGLASPGNAAAAVLRCAESLIQ